MKKPEIRTTNNVIVICRERHVTLICFKKLNRLQSLQLLYYQNAIQYFLDAFQMKLLQVIVIVNVIVIIRYLFIIIIIITIIIIIRYHILRTSYGSGGGGGGGGALPYENDGDAGLA